MKKVTIAVVLTLFVLMVIGCATKQKVETNEATVQSLISENRDLRNKVTELEQKVGRVEASAKSDAESLKEENLKMKASLSEMEKKISTPPPPPPPPPPPVEPKGIQEGKKPPETKKVRIKVLSGTGDRKSATAMTVRLKELGYKVTSIDLARRNDYKVDTVFYADRFLTEAERLASEINGEIKPLSWKSRFDLIVVTGKSSP